MKNFKTLSILLGSVVAILILMLMSFGCAPRINAGTLNTIRFFSVSHIPVVEGKINGKRAYFIIDTGASCSIVDETVSKRYGFNLILKVEDNVFGLGGQAKLGQAKDCIVEIGPLRFTNTIFRSKPLDYLTSVIRNEQSVDVSGIIGSDILNRYKLSINYHNNSICFNP